jgi:hypothetical protein
MKTSILYSAMLVLLFSACTTAFKTGQTPDDVYYSPAPEVIEYSGSRNSYANPDDQYLRMKVRNQQRWSMIDDFTYWNSPYNYYGVNYNNWFLNPSLIQPFGINNFYNTWGFVHGNFYVPYHPGFIIKNPVKSVATNRPRLSGYNNYIFNNKNDRNPKSYSSKTYNNNNSNRTFNNNSSFPERTYTPSSSNNNSRGSSSSGSGGGISRPTRN